VRLLFGHDALVARWVSLHIPHMGGADFGPSSAIGVVDDQGLIRAGVVYHNWLESYRSIELSCASDTPRWATPEIVRALLRYPFVQLNCQRCTSVTPLKSDQPRRFLKRLGFTQEGIARLGFGDDHAVIYGLLAKEWARHPLSTPRRTRTGVPDGQENAESADAA
jgi:hypothetical protein